MSAEAIGWAFRRVQMDDATAKFVLIALCNYANDEDQAWPSHATLAAITGLSRRTVQASVKKLEDWGIIRRVHQERDNGSQTSARVFIDLDSRWTVEGGVAAPAIPMAAPAIGGAQELPQGIAADAPLEPSLNHHIETSLKVTRADFDLWFDHQFWPEYPKRYGTNPKKPAADKMFIKIKSGEKPEKVLAGVRRFRAECVRQRIDGSKYVMQAVRWINGESWNDDPLPEGGGAPRDIFDVTQDLENRVTNSDHRPNGQLALGRGHQDR